MATKISGRRISRPRFPKRTVYVVVIDSKAVAGYYEHEAALIQALEYNHKHFDLVTLEAGEDEKLLKQQQQYQELMLLPKKNIPLDQLETLFKLQKSFLSGETDEAFIDRITVS